jgi:hypothetical protein
MHATQIRLLSKQCDCTTRPTWKLLAACLGEAPLLPFGRSQAEALRASSSADPPHPRFASLVSPSTHALHLYEARHFEGLVRWNSSQRT